MNLSATARDVLTKVTQFQNVGEDTRAARHRGFEFQSLQWYLFFPIAVQLEYEGLS